MNIGDRVMVKTEKGYWPGRIHRVHPLNDSYTVWLDKVPGRQLPEHENVFPFTWMPVRHALPADLLPMGKAISAK
jgi:hypothetical protein